MAMSLLQLAKKVLEEEKRALSAWEIWQIAEIKGYDKLVDSNGITSAASLLSAWIHADVRANPRSVFISLRDEPHKFILRRHMADIRPSKKVRILEHFHNIVDDFTHITQVFATKDSIGVVLSYEEYREHADTLHRKDLERRSLKDPVLRSLMQDTHFRHLEWVRESMNAGTYYPVRFEKFVPLPDNDYARLRQEYSIIDIVCQVGAVIVLPTNTFVFI